MLKTKRNGVKPIIVDILETSKRIKDILKNKNINLNKINRKIFWRN
jgi:hypothetical protein